MITTRARIHHIEKEKEKKNKRHTQDDNISMNYIRAHAKYIKDI